MDFYRRVNELFRRVRAYLIFFRWVCVLFCVFSRFVVILVLVWCDFYTLHIKYTRTSLCWRNRYLSTSTRPDDIRSKEPMLLKFTVHNHAIIFKTKDQDQSTSAIGNQLLADFSYPSYGFWIWCSQWLLKQQSKRIFLF